MIQNKLIFSYFSYIDQLCQGHHVPFMDKKSKENYETNLQNKEHNIMLCHIQVVKFSKDELRIKRTQLEDMIVADKLTGSKEYVILNNTLELCEGCILLYGKLQIN